MAEAAAVLFFLFSTTGPFQGYTLPFQGKSFLFRVTLALSRATIIKRKVFKVENYYILLF